MGTPDKYFIKTEENQAAFTPHIYEIHGNIDSMHCSNEEEKHSDKFFTGPSLEEADKFKEKNDRTLVPTCTECGQNMKPHCMFFDEAYSERYYRYETVDKFCEEADCLIVIGTALATSFASNIVKGFLIGEKPVIEVNLKSSIHRGFNI